MNKMKGLYYLKEGQFKNQLDRRKISHLFERCKLIVLYLLFK